MKKLFTTSAAMFVLAATTFAVATPNATAQTKKKPTTQSQTIPPPTCPYNDPNGCGIFD